MLTVYTAGAIRGGNNFEYDNEWREYAAARIVNESVNNVRVISPLSYKTYDKDRDVWLMFDKFPIEPNSILEQDLMSITQGHIILMNLLPFSYDGLTWTNLWKPRLPWCGDAEFHYEGGHPMIGTFAEFGISFAQRKPIIVVADDTKLITHPFIAAGAHRIFNDLDDGIDYTIGLIRVQSGE